jgi:hypothetical protein
MAVLPASSTPTISPAEMQILVSRAGLVLNPGQVADLVLAWRQIAGLIAGLPADRPMADDMAVGFRLPPPAGTATATPARPTAPSIAVPAKAAPQPKRAKAKAAAPAAAKSKMAHKPPARRGAKHRR